ncbi:MAG: hypothetical protein Q7J86_11030 [Bacteroidota bacterium]|nr:hypothetical protein [Bacteroidota bacterium]
MEISNQKRSKQIKRGFNIGGIIIVLAGLGLLSLKNDVGVMIAVGVFVVYVGISQFANLCYVFFSTENGKVLIKYYPIITIMKKEYGSVEFAQKALVNFRIERAMGFKDLEIAIRTTRGIAEYPQISLSALSKVEIEQIVDALTEIIRNNKKGA